MNRKEGRRVLVLWVLVTKLSEFPEENGADFVGCLVIFQEKDNVLLLDGLNLAAFEPFGS